jgi:hypothetical protein
MMPRSRTGRWDIIYDTPAIYQAGSIYRMHISYVLRDLPSPFAYSLILPASRERVGARLSIPPSSF